MLLAPFISLMESKLDKKSYSVPLIIMFCMGFMIPYGKIYAGGKSLFGMFYVFLVGDYIHLFRLPNIIINHTKTIFYSLLCIYTLAVLGLEIIMSTDFDRMVGQYESHSFASDSPIFFLSLTLFIWASKKPSTGCVKFYKLCVNITPYILAIYLIHMNRYFYSYIWDFVRPQRYHIPVALHALISCSILFILCIGIDYIRGLLFAKLRVDKLIEMIVLKIKFTKVNLN